MTEQIAITENTEARRYEAHVDGALAGFADYRDTDAVRSFVHTEIDPSFGGRGIGSQLMRWIELRARAHGDAVARQTRSDANTGARDLFLSNGYEASFVSWIIRIELAEPPEPPTIPHGISIRPFPAADAADVHRVIDAAFCEWKGRHPEPFEVWASEVLAHPSFAPEISPLAFDGGELVGAVMSSDYPEHGEGWVMQLATRATHRRRGIAQALLLTAFGWFYERGRRIVGVSTDSRTGALGLYEKVGMRVQRQYTRYVKPLS